MLTFGPGMRLHNAAQVTFPVSTTVAITRNWSVEAAASYASTTLESVDGIRAQLRGLTDSQFRTTYTLSRDAAVFSLGLNLPTGESTISSEQLPVVRSIAQNFVPFPVSNYGAGLGVTGAGAVARSLGDWKVGAAASVRYLSSYQPLADLPGDYSPGLEVRVRLGVDRLLGERTRLTSAVTVSTFGTDDFTGSGAANFNFRPGRRCIGELTLTHQVGSSPLQAFGWAFLRTAGDSSGVSIPEAREALYYAGLAGTFTPNGWFSFTPGIDLRIWRPTDGGRGQAFGVRSAAVLRLRPGVSLVTSARGERGFIRIAGQGEGQFWGFGASTMLRVVFGR